MDVNNLGQFFTTNDTLQKKVRAMVMNSPVRILEPSVGRGDLLIPFQGEDIEWDMYEVDRQVPFHPFIHQARIHYGDFLQEKIPHRYKTIIGNPPYVRTRHGNLYLDFTLKCFELLEPGGELIFIVPSDFFKLTCASRLLTRMVQHGTFTHVFHPHDETLFEKAQIDVMVFRYCKDPSLPSIVQYNEKRMYLLSQDGMVTFHKDEPSGRARFNALFTAHVGMVSGMDSVFKNSRLGNMEILVKEGRMEKFIFVKSFPTLNAELDTYLESWKDALMSRRIKTFNESNWYEWGGLRNIHVMEGSAGKDCIYLHNLTRSSRVAFRGKVGYFGGSLIMLLPREDAVVDLDAVLEFLNSRDFQENFIFAGRFKIGQRQILQSLMGG